MLHLLYSNQSSSSTFSSLLEIGKTGTHFRGRQMKKALIIHHIPRFKGWETCFHYLLKQCDTFKIIFQGDKDTSDPGELNVGKQEFLALPRLFISPYAGMEHSIEVTGELSTAARELFSHFMASSFNGYKPELWSFRLLQGQEVRLRIEDFSVAILFLTEDDVEYLSSRGVDTREMLEADIRSL